MGFFDFLTGTSNNQPSDSSNSSTPAHTPGPSFDKSNENTFPVVYIRSAKTNINGNKVQVYCQIMNAFTAPIQLYKITLFATTRNLGAVLHSNEVRELLVYDGPPLMREYPEIYLDYKTENEKDYFQAVHEATFSYHPDDKTYTVSNITLRHPIRDIYG
jgi:hypothetical protein